MSHGTFSDLLIRLEAFEIIFVFRSKIDIWPRGKHMILVKNEHIFKSTFFIPLCS